MLKKHNSSSSNTDIEQQFFLLPNKFNSIAILVNNVNVSFFLLFLYILGNTIEHKEGTAKKNNNKMMMIQKGR